MKSLGYVLILFIFLSCGQKKDTSNTTYDIVIENARVIDPETSTDQVLNVAISGDKIAEISTHKLAGKKMIDGNGKILSPGFIDLHAHGQTNKENEYQAFDGVTTALELEIGIDTLKQYYQARKGNALINFGASACQLAYRNKVIANSDRVYRTIYEELKDSAATVALPKKKFNTLRSKLKDALNNGAIGIGVPVGYLPNASIEEIEDIYAFAGEHNLPVFSHIREGGAIAFQQAISDAILNKTQLHLCHLPSMARKDIDFCLQAVEKAQALGFPITTELYPYTAGNTEIGSAIFNEGWQERLGCVYKDLQWVETGERLTPETFKKYRKQGGSVIVHMMKENWVDGAIKSSSTMIASDGGGYSPLGHPRSSGTFCKTIREYVNEKNIISINSAIEKMTLMPAQVLEDIVPDMKLRGRIQVGSYADLLLFELNKVKDNATYTSGFEKSSGMSYVIVNGKILIKEGVLQEKTFPGKAIKSDVQL
ncbi:amidohydrolase family protein [Patiriisocius hiemis]|uniref:Amidohydrolase family protein n=1 Tax=Patiriisocius hiemis TaxID=3075604 RepID=A0ABU2YD79_9FLAO|nr:amidohydrolase family protein [Constantimarinum sp. W242]MDT0556144.1 amidohydrolase family protein [Constantimarinum sp. W242]